jgi:glyoxylase-like metal-dependent hydrolase (beta-lactamase superfamily II)
MQISERIYLVGSEEFALSHALDCNCYLIDGGSALGIVDSGLGLGVDEMLANVKAHGFSPDRISHVLITHAHLGHWGGAAGFRERTGAEVWAPANQRSMTDPSLEPGIAQNIKFGRYPPGFEPTVCPPDGLLKDGERIAIGDIEIQSILVQGHTKDSTCFLIEDDGRRGLFSGDVVFYGGKLGILNIEGFSFDDYRRDIRKLADLEIDMLFPGHGVFVLRRAQKHIKRAIQKLSDFVMPETFFEQNEFLWDREYLEIMSD